MVILLHPFLGCQWPTLGQLYRATNSFWSAETISWSFQRWPLPGTTLAVNHLLKSYSFSQRPQSRLRLRILTRISQSNIGQSFTRLFDYYVTATKLWSALLTVDFSSTRISPSLLQLSHSHHLVLSPSSFCLDQSLVGITVLFQIVDIWEVHSTDCSVYKSCEFYWDNQISLYLNSR